MYRQRALDHLAAPEQLDQYLTVSQPRWWVVLAALGLLLTAALLWSFLGQIPTLVPLRGVAAGAPGGPLAIYALAPVTTARRLSASMAAQVTTDAAGSDRQRATVVWVGTEPATDAALAAAMGQPQWLRSPNQESRTVLVVIGVTTGAAGAAGAGSGLVAGADYQVQVITGQQRPVDVLFGR